MSDTTATIDHAAIIAATLEGAEIFHHSAGAGAVVIQFNAGPNGEAYIIDIDENGSTRSAMTEEFETGWDA